MIRGDLLMACLHKRPAALGFCVAAALMCTAPASESMEPAVLVMFEKVGMSGRSVTYDGAVADIDVRYPFHSASVKSGRWELCTRNNFKGACVDMDAGSDIVSLKKEFGMLARIRSVRPGPGASISQGVAPVPAAASQQTTADAPMQQPAATAEAMLRGDSAHFFKTPMLDGATIDAEDHDAIRRFCREAGLIEVKFSAPVASAGGSIVGDLLCAGPYDGSEQGLADQ